MCFCFVCSFPFCCVLFCCLFRLLILCVYVCVSLHCVVLVCTLSIYSCVSTWGLVESAVCTSVPWNQEWVFHVRFLGSHCQWRNHAMMKRLSWCNGPSYVLQILFPSCDCIPSFYFRLTVIVSQFSLQPVHCHRNFSWPSKSNVFQMSLFFGPLFATQASTLVSEGYLRALIGDRDALAGYWAGMLTDFPDLGDPMSSIGCTLYGT